jgi:hypothetical protein
MLSAIRGWGAEFRRGRALPYVLGCLAILALILPFAGKPPHIDDPNFLALAEGARADWWRPHAISINWTGITQPAFRVLSNPPGVAWWMAPMLRLPLPLQHLWMTLWVAPFLWGVARLGRRFAGSPVAALLLFGTSPVFVLAAGSFQPDLPLVGLMTAGLAGFIDAVDEDRQTRAFLWAMVAGASFLFRYSGVTALPLLALYALLKKRNPWPALGACLPILALYFHDLSAYGEFHFLAMTRFQQQRPSLLGGFRKLLGAIAVLGGSLVPVALPRGRRWAVGACLLALIAGIAAIIHADLPVAPALWTMLIFFVGSGLLVAVIEGLALGPDRRDALFLALWMLGGVAFMLTLLFMASRYWLPFLAPVLLAALARRPRKAVLAAAIGLQFSVSLCLAVDDYQFAKVYEVLADKVCKEAERRSPNAPRYFAGHWGWQGIMAARGWKPLEECQPIPSGSLLAAVEGAWPQATDPHAELDLLWQDKAPCRSWGPRTYTFDGRANMFTYGMWRFDSGTSPTYAPWGFGRDPREQVLLFQVDQGPAPAPASPAKR